MEKAMSSADLQLEALGLDREVQEYEGGSPQYEGVLGEYEAPVGPPTRAMCGPYQRGEVQKSRTQQGHLPADVIRHSRGLLIADFGVDWRTPKSSLARDPELRAVLTELIQVARTNATTKIRIIGFSDCVGRERNNRLLRLGRARKMAALLSRMGGPQWQALRTRITVVAAPAGDYIADNGTVAGRAQNRSVLIESFRSYSDEGSVIEGRVPDTMDRICKRGLELIQQREHFGTRVGTHAQKCIRWWLKRLCQSGFDDRYLTGQGVLDYNNKVADPPYYASAKQWLLPAFAVRAGGKRSDKDIWQTLIRIDDDIRQGYHTINRFYHTHGAATPVRVQRLRDWVAGQEKNDQTIYWCYPRTNP
jgi:outer membrane protein OmpA-like peptidoglycan-associated protein